MFKCPFCSFTCGEEKYYTQHYVKKHRLEKSFQIQCKLCAKDFVNWSTFKSHFQREHRRQLEGKIALGFVSYSLNSVSSYILEMCFVPTGIGYNPRDSAAPSTSSASRPSADGKYTIINIFTLLFYLN